MVMVNMGSSVNVCSNRVGSVGLHLRRPTSGTEGLNAAPIKGEIMLDMAIQEVVTLFVVCEPPCRVRAKYRDIKEKALHI